MAGSSAEPTKKYCCYSPPKLRRRSPTPERTATSGGLEPTSKALIETSPVGVVVFDWRDRQARLVQP